MGFPQRNRTGIPQPTDQRRPPGLPSPDRAQVNYHRDMTGITYHHNLTFHGQYGESSGVVRPSGVSGGQNADGAFGEHNYGGDDNRLKGRPRITSSSGDMTGLATRRFNGTHTFIGRTDGAAYGYQRPFSIKVANDQGRRVPEPWDKGLSQVVTDPNFRF